MALKDSEKSRSGMASAKSWSPGHVLSPELNVPDSGPEASEALPVVNKIPSVNGKEIPFPEKYPIPFVELKSVPVENIIFETSAQELLISTSSTNSSTEYVD